MRIMDGAVSVIVLGVAVAAAYEVVRRQHRDKPPDHSKSDPPASVPQVPTDWDDSPLFPDRESFPGVDMTYVEHTYDVHGEYSWQARESVKALGPDGYAGVTNWNVSWNVTPHKTAGGYVADTPVVTLAIDMLLPRWRERTVADSGEQAAWSYMMRNLRKHEAGHVRIAMQGATDAASAIRKLGTFSTPDALTAAAGSAVSVALARSTAAHEAYDQTTQHGLKQDAAQ